MKYVNADLTSLEQRKYNAGRIIDTLLTAIGTVLILVYFENLSVVISCLLTLIATGTAFIWLQLKYEQYQDIKLMLSFFLFSVGVAAIFWLTYLL